MGDDKFWRDFVNGMKVDDLPTGGPTSSDIETIPKLPKGAKEPQQMVYVQKMVTEVYVFTDLEGNAFGQQAFQTAYQLGEMSAKKLMNVLEKERRKKEK